MNIEAYRLYHMDIPEYPFIIDRYGPYIIVWNRLNEEVDALLLSEIPELQAEMAAFFELSSE